MTRDRPTLQIQACAKINLHLRVFPLQGGYHPLRSWFRTVSVSDQLEIAPGGDHGRFQLTCDDPAVPTGGSNLIAKAWQRLDGKNRPSVNVHLQKRLPMGGGLGGGSSNAAAALLGLADFWKIDCTLDDAAALGSDVPFFFRAMQSQISDATVTGRGEHVEPFHATRRHAVLLILPGLHCSTPAVFRQFDALPTPPDDGDPDFAAWSALPATRLLPKLRNDLEVAALMLYPKLADLRTMVEQNLQRPVRMSGSGSTLFTLYDDGQDAFDAAYKVGLPLEQTAVG